MYEINLYSLVKHDNATQNSLIQGKFLLPDAYSEPS